MSVNLSKFLRAIASNNREMDESSFFESLIGIYDGLTHGKQLPLCVHDFSLNDESAGNIISILKNVLQNQGVSCISQMSAPLTYLLDELICNIQQHARTDKGYAYIGYDSIKKTVELIIADAGITIYGSYVSAQKYLELIGNSDAEALSLAQSGYSTKNLPNAENRGYGISSNIRMVVEGLHGEFAVLSGNALLIQSVDKKKILALPQEVDLKGTMVIVSFPASIPEDFNLYNYIV